MKVARFIAGAVMLMVFVVRSFATTSASEIAPMIDHLRRDPYGMTLSVPTPSLQRVVDMEITFQPLMDLPNTTVKVLLPDGIVAHSETTLTLDLVAGQKQTRNVSIEVVSFGAYSIVAVASNPRRQGGERAAHYFVSSTPFGAFASDHPLFDHSNARTAVVVPTKADTVPTPPDAVCGYGSFVVTSTWNYTDDTGAIKPLRRAKAEVWDPVAERSLATCFTDTRGVLAVAVSGDAPFNIVVSSEFHFDGVSVPLKVKQGDADDAAEYQVSSPQVALDYSNGPSSDLGVFTVPLDQSAPFLALDAAMKEWDTVLDSQAALQDLPAVRDTADFSSDAWQRFFLSMPELKVERTIHYPSSTCKTFDGESWRCGGTSDIYLADHWGSDFPWDRFTVYHELAHALFLAAENLPLECAPGYHQMTSTTCESFAFWEGWAEFMEAAVENNPNVFAPGACAKSIDGNDNLEKNYYWKGSRCRDDNDGRSVEGAVASALWDVFDASANDDDSYAPPPYIGIGLLWSAIKGHPATLNDVYDSLGQPQTLDGVWNLDLFRTKLLQENLGIASGPVVETRYPQADETRSLTLLANVNTLGLPTSAWFEYATQPDFSDAVAMPAQVLPVYPPVQSLAVPTPDVPKGVLYYFRAAAANANGRSAGRAIKIGPPTIAAVRMRIDNTSSGTGVLDVTSNSFPTTASIVVAKDPALLNAQTVAQADFEAKVSRDRAGLPVCVCNTHRELGFSVYEPGTTYYYQVRAANDWGETAGPIEAFTVPIAGSSIGETEGASAATNSAVMRGTVYSTGLGSQAWFEWGTAPDQLVNRTPAQSMAGGASDETDPGTAILGNVSGLSPRTTYFYRIVAKNDIAITESDIANFTTPPDPVPAIASAATNTLTDDSFNLLGSINPNGSEISWWVEYGPSRDNLNRRTPVQKLDGNMALLTDVQVNTTINGLQSSSTYFYRLVASSDGGAKSTAVAPVTTRSTMVPTLTTANPSSLLVGAGGTNLLVSGQMFRPGTQVFWNGQPRPTRYVDANTLVLTLLPGDMDRVGRSTLTVQNPGRTNSSSTLMIDITLPVLQRE